MDANCKFKVKSWDEKPYREFESGAKYTRCQVEYEYTGDFEGSSTLQYLMYYRPDGTGTFVGLEHLTGTLAGKTGSFSAQINGTYTTEGVQATQVIVHGSGTDGLIGMSGMAKQHLIGEKDWYPFVLDYDLPSS